LTGGLDSIVGDEFKSVDGTFAEDSAVRVLSLDFSSEGVSSSSSLVPDELSESLLDRLVTAEDGLVGLTWVIETAGRALSDEADRPSERDSSISGTGGFTAGVLIVLAASGAEVLEVISTWPLGRFGEVASTASIDFWASRRDFPSQPRPTVSATLNPINANKNTSAASRNPNPSPADTSGTGGFEAGPSIESDDDSNLRVGT
jgi:hypothetical protein